MLNTNVPLIYKSCVPYPRSASLNHLKIFLSFNYFIDCAEEPVVHNAVLVETFGLHKNLGYSLRYRCNPGRTMEGYPWALCQQDGTWKTLFSCCECI